MDKKGYAIKVSKITDKGDLSFIEGYMWKTDELTLKAFNEQKERGIEFQKNAICLDLINENNDIVDTATITCEMWNRLRG